ncbi:hypothetical protein, partial [Salinispira pacifica]
MNGAVTVTGFIVHSFTRTIKGVSTLCLVGRCSDRRTFAVLLTGVRPSFLIRRSDLERIETSEVPPPDETAEPALRTFDGERCVELRFGSETGAQRAADALRRLGIRTYEADIDTIDRYLMDRAIHGAVTISGTAQAG